MKNDLRIFPAREYEGKMCVEEKVAVNSVRNNGHVIIICNKNGNKKKALWVDKEQFVLSSEYCGYTTFHAKIPVDQGDYIIEVKHNRGVVELYIYEVMCIASNGLLLKLVFEDKGTDWDKKSIGKIYNYGIYGILNKAVMAAHLKVYDFDYLEKPYCISASKKQV